jgi:filamentous hemagglutinin family protein
MNRIYRLAWNRSLGCFVPASEVTRARGKGKSGRSNRAIHGNKRGAAAALAAAAAVSMGPLSARAGPTGGQIIAGSGIIGQSGNTTTISQDSQTLSLNWATFNIAPQETVSFLQPSAAAIAINRIVDVNGTQILGHLNANGQIFLINPNGVLFGRGAQVDVGGLVASTLDLSDTGAAGNSKTFSGTGSGSVINQGSITAADGGYVALLGNHVGNQGVIAARLGSVGLGAGNSATLTFNGNELVSLQVSQSVLNSEADNGGLIQADGGRVIMTAGAKDALLASVVNNTGVIEARTVDDQGGVITLLGGMADGTVNVGGTLDASAPHGGNGGSIETSAAHVEVAGDANVTTVAAAGLYGSWLIDPKDYTVAATGGDITGAALGTQLATTNVTLQSSAGATAGSGNVNVNAAVSWTANTTLTLTASNNVNVNASITASGNTAGMVINPNTANGTETASGTGAFLLGAGAAVNLPGTNPSLSIGGVSYTVINTLGAQGSVTGTDLQGINGNLGGHFALGSNIDASATSGWNAGAGFTPIGANFPYFTGSFEGLGHTITNLTINLPGSNYVGLFGRTGAVGAVIQDVGLVGGSVSGNNNVGELAGYSDGPIANSYATGSSTGAGAYVGGLIGNDYGSVSNSHATGAVSGAGFVGGLIGNIAAAVSITNSYATGNVTGQQWTGGLVGQNNSASATVSGSFATGQVQGSTYVGGLMGYNKGSAINDYATGPVSGTGDDIGGLVGANLGSISVSYASGSATGSASGYLGGLVGDNNHGSIANSYASGPVIGGTGSYVGGLVGRNNYGSISDAYSTGSVTSSGTNVGGLVGVNINNGGTTTGSFWNTTTSGQMASAGGVGMTTTQLVAQANFTSATAANGNVNPAWDFTGTWFMYQGETAPLLRYFLTPLTITPTAATKQYDRNPYSGGNGLSYSTTPNLSNLFNTSSYGGTAQGAVNVGSYTITSNAYSNQQGYLITYANGTLTVTAAPLTVTGETAANKPYDGTFAATLTGGSLSGVLSGDQGTVTLNQTGSFVSKNVGTGIAVTATDTLGGSGAGNYTISQQPTGLTANITALGLTVAGETANNKIYDGTFAATLTGGTLSGVLNADLGTVTLNQTGTFATKNVGTGIAVTATDTLGGSGAGNYTISQQPTGLTANITPLGLTVTGETAHNKVYDGTFAATLTGGSLSGVLSGDQGTVTLNQTGSFASKNVGTGIAVTATDTLSGANAGNYMVTQPTGLSASITVAPLTVATEIADNKVYDNTFTATLTGGTLVGAVAGDAVSLVQAGSFASKNVGLGIAVTAADSLSGASAANYSLTQPTGLTANITPASLTVTGETAANKVYDGTVAATLTGGTLVGIVAGDGASLTLTDSGHFASKNAGSGVAVTATDTFSGTGSGNYTLVQPTGITATITPLAASVSGETANNKVYDATTAATLSGGVLNGILPSDTGAVTLSQTGQFASPNVGTGIAVTASDTLSGASGGNYTLTQPTGLTANITAKAVTVAGESASNKIYDGTLAATLTGGTLAGAVPGDAVTLIQAGSFASKNVGQGIAVTAADTLGGTSAANYTLTEPIGLSANISPATLTYLATPISFHAETTPAGLAGTVNGFVPGDTLANSTTGTLAWMTPATASSPPGSYAIDGTGLSAVNYVFVQATANATALTIEPLTGPPVVQNAIAQAESLLPSPQSNIVNTLMQLSPAIALTDTAGVTASTVADGAPPADVLLFNYESIAMDSPTAPRVTIPAVHIVDGGVKVPDNTVSVNE